MNLGLGIFLGSLFLGTVVLYLNTRDAWNWRTIWKRIGLTVSGLVVLLAVAIAGTTGYEKLQDRPQVVTSLKGISLGEKLSDVVLRYGEFKEVTPKDGEKSKREGIKRYVKEDKSISVKVRGGRIEAIVYSCNRERDYTSIGEITCGRSGNEILSRFEGDVRVKCRIKMSDANDKLARLYDVLNLGVRYILEKDTVIALVVMEKQILADWTEINWQSCS